MLVETSKKHKNHFLTTYLFNKTAMKKAFIMMMVLLALPFAMQAQSKFHDVELAP